MTAFTSDLSVRLWNTVQERLAAPFWIAQDQMRSYSELRDIILDVTAVLAAKKVVVGDIVVIATPQDWTAFGFWIGCVLNGVIPVMVAADAGADRLSRLCAKADPVLALISAARAEEPWVQMVNSVVIDADFADKTHRRPHRPSCLRPQDDTAYILFTSGSTSAPKGVVITHENLGAQLAKIARVLQVRPDARIYNGLVLYHVDGLVQGPLLALWASAALLRPQQAGGPQIAADMDWMAAQKASHLITAPPFLELMDRACTRDDLFQHADFIAILSSAARLPQPLWERIEKRFGVTVVNEYGMTETVAASHFAGDLPDMGTRFGIGRPVDCEARLVGPDGRAPGPGAAGALQVRGKNIFTGYFAEPELTAAAFQDGWFQTGDLARRDSAGNYDIVGRVNTAINFGGFLIRPEEVDEVICRHPDIVASQTCSLEDDVFGQIPACAIVTKHPVDTNDILAFCRAHLEPQKVPKRIVCIPDIPLTGSGKPDIAALRNLLQRHGAKPVLSADRPGLVTLEIAASVFGVDQAALSEVSTPETTPGWDSYAHTALLLEIEEAFSIDIATADMMSVASLGDLIRVVRASLEEDDSAVASKVLQPIRPGADRSSLVIMPGVAGQPAYVARLLGHFSMDTSIYGVSVDLNTHDTVAQMSIQAMARTYADEIVAMKLPQPVTLLGHSFGGFMAYEVAVALMDQGVHVNGAVLLDTAVPWTHRRGRHLHQAAQQLRKLRGLMGGRPDTASVVTPNSVADVLNYSRFDLMTVPEAQRPLVKQSFAAMADYVPSRSRVPMLVFSAAVRKQGRVPIERDLGWGRFSTGPIRSMTLGERHLSIVLDDETAKIAALNINKIVQGSDHMQG